MNFPYVHIAGDTLDFRVSVPDYPSTDGWTLKYHLTPRFSTPTQAPIHITASGNADGTYQVQESPANTAIWRVGAYGWARTVEKVGARQTLTSSEDQGEVLIRQDPATATQGYDGRSHARKMLAQIEAAIEAFQNPTVKEYTIGTRSLTRNDMKDILDMRDKYRAEVANEEAIARIAAGGSNPRNIGIRFNRV
jgi:hypothetical protein